MKVLVIGATGRVGNEVVKALLQRGASVRALTRKQRKPDAFPGVVESALGDLNDPASTAKAIKGVDKLFLLMQRERSRRRLLQKISLTAATRISTALKPSCGKREVRAGGPGISASRFEGFVERGFTNTEDQAMRFAALLKHQPRTYSSFAEELTREWDAA
jgi:putative NADH-flavin reductase